MAISVTRKKMKAVLDVSPLSEMPRDTREWCEKNRFLKGKLKNYTASQVVALDPRKWNERDLGKALAALARFELKLFAVKVGDYIKAAKTRGTNGEIEAQGKILKLYEKIGKEIEKKASLALEEISEDKGDNTRGLSEGKAALKAMAALNFRKIFGGPGAKASAAFEDLARALGSAGDDEDARDKALQEADKALDAAQSDFDKGREAAFAAITLLQKTARKIAKNDNAAPELNAFGNEIVGHDKLCNALIEDFEKYAGELTDALNAVRGDKLDQVKARRLAAELGATARFARSGDAMKAAIGKLSASYAKLQQELK